MAEFMLPTQTVEFKHLSLDVRQKMVDLGNLRGVLVLISALSISHDIAWMLDILFIVHRCHMQKIVIFFSDTPLAPINNVFAMGYIITALRAIRFI